MSKPTEGIKTYSNESKGFGDKENSAKYETKTLQQHKNPADHKMTSNCELGAPKDLLIESAQQAGITPNQVRTNASGVKLSNLLLKFENLARDEEEETRRRAQEQKRLRKEKDQHDREEEAKKAIKVDNMPAPAAEEARRPPAKGSSDTVRVQIENLKRNMQIDKQRRTASVYAKRLFEDKVGSDHQFHVRNSAVEMGSPTARKYRGAAMAKFNNMSTDAEIKFKLKLVEQKQPESHNDKHGYESLEAAKQMNVEYVRQPTTGARRTLSARAQIPLSATVSDRFKNFAKDADDIAWIRIDREIRPRREVEENAVKTSKDVFSTVIENLKNLAKNVEEKTRSIFTESTKTERDSAIVETANYSSAGHEGGINKAINVFNKTLRKSAPRRHSIAKKPTYTVTRTESAVDRTWENLMYYIKDTGIHAVAMFDYEQADDDEISFSTDDVITHIDRFDKDWWRGLCHNRYGVFPANLVKVIKRQENCLKNNSL